MPWYRTGQVAITAGQTTVTGTGTNFTANARVGDAFQGPDGRWYEVTNIASATVLSILPAYQGASVSGGTYGLAPMQGYVKESADRLRQLVEQYGATLAGLSPVASQTVVPVSMGGTGGATAAAARANLGLGTAAVGVLTGSDYDAVIGKVMKVGDFGIGAPNGGTIRSPNLTYIPGLSRFNGEEAGVPRAGTGGSLITNTLGGSYIQQIAQDPSGGVYNPYIAVRHFSSTGSPGPWCPLYHTGNTTRSADGTLKAI